MRLPKLQRDANGHPIIPKGYRKLNPEEIIQKGDITNFTSEWEFSKNMGFTVSISLEFSPKNLFVYIRKIGKEAIPKIKITIEMPLSAMEKIRQNPEKFISFLKENEFPIEKIIFPK